MTKIEKSFYDTPTNQLIYSIMISFIYTLLTLAAGMFVGSAGIFLTRRINHLFKTLLWIVIMFPLLIGGFMLSMWSEGQAHPHSLSAVLSKLMAVAIYVYGIFLSLTLHFRTELKTALQDASKIEWITAACARLLQQLPLTLWVIFILLSPWDCYTALATAVGISFITLIILWLAFHFVWWLKHPFKKNPRFS